MLDITEPVLPRFSFRGRRYCKPHTQVGNEISSHIRRSFVLRLYTPHDVRVRQMEEVEVEEKLWSWLCPVYLRGGAGVHLEWQSGSSVINATSFPFPGSMLPI